MEDHFSDELISAYLDNELTPSQRDEVEAALRNDDELRRMFDNLRSQRDSLKSLPDFEIGGDFARRVLQQAERTMLSEPHKEVGLSEPHKEVGYTRSGHTGSGDSQHEQPASLPLSPTKLNQAPWRKLVFGGAAIAAGLLIMYLLPRSEREVSKSLPQESSDMAAVTEDSASALSPADEGMSGLPEASIAEAKTANGARHDPDSQSEPASRSRGAPVASKPQPAKGVLGGGGGERFSKSMGFSNQADNKIVVIRLKVSAAALKNAAFENTLKKNQIYFSDPGRVAQLQSSSLVAPESPALGDKQANRESKVQKKKREAKEREQNKETSDKKILSGKKAKIDQVTMVYVEASPQQISGALSDLEKMAMLTSGFKLSDSATLQFALQFDRAVVRPLASKLSSPQANPKPDSKSIKTEAFALQESVSGGQLSAGRAWRFSPAELPDGGKYLTVQEEAKESKDQRRLIELEVELEHFFRQSIRKENAGKQGKDSKLNLDDQSKNKKQAFDAPANQNLARDKNGSGKADSSPKFRILFVLDLIDSEPAKKQTSDSDKK